MNARAERGGSVVPVRRRATVQTWFTLVLVGLVVLIGVAALAVASQEGLTARSTDRLLDRTEPAVAQAYRLQAALADQETGARGYAVTGEQQFLQPYTQGLATERDAAGTLSRLVGDRPLLAADQRALGQAAAAWRSGFAEPLIAQVRREGKDSVSTPLLARGKAQFDHIRALSQTQNRHLAAAVAQGRASVNHARGVRNAVVIGIVGVLLLAGVAFIALLHMMVARPLRELGTASRRVAQGEFDTRIPAVGPADLRAVADDVEEMRRRIVADLSDSRRKELLLIQRTQEQQEQEDELRRSNAELEQFAYVASHDLQEPLRKVASFCQLLEKRYGDQLDERGTQYVNFAVDGAKRMQVLINDLLTFSRVGRLGATHVPVRMDATLERAMTNLAGAVEEADARVERPADLGEFTGDPTLLTMLWQNLIGNAVKFRGPDTPPLIRVEAAPGEDGVWHFSVTDNGIGIAEEFAEKVFVIFQRLHSRDVYGGTGIGLALCKKIVEHHGGRIWLDSAHTGGTRFRFTLPGAVRTEAPEAPEPAAAEPSAGGMPTGLR